VAIQGNAVNVSLTDNADDSSFNFTLTTPSGRALEPVELFKQDGQLESRITVVFKPLHYYGNNASATFSIGK